MIPDVGTTALFTFKSQFEILNGVYRVRAQTTFGDALAANVNFVDSLYTPAGLQASDYNADYLGYANDRVIVLESVKDANTVYYVPESTLKTIPDPTIKEYFNLVAVVSLGVFSNTQEILPLLDQMTDLVQASIGVSNPLQVVSNPNNKVYLTDSAYATLEAARKANITSLLPLSVQLKQALDELTVLKAKLALYEQKITGLAQS